MCSVIFLQTCWDQYQSVKPLKGPCFIITLILRQKSGAYGLHAILHFFALKDIFFVQICTITIPLAFGRWIGSYKYDRTCSIGRLFLYQVLFNISSCDCLTQDMFSSMFKSVI